MGHTATDLHRQEIRITVRLITVTIAVLLLRGAVIRADAAARALRMVAVEAAPVRRVVEVAVVEVEDADKASLSLPVNGQSNR